MEKTFDARWFVSRLGNPTRRGIAQETAALVRTGALPVGAKLPTVRDLAYELRVSPATVSQAWADLRRHKIISGRGRNGSWVISDSFTPRPERLMSGGLTPRPGLVDLARAVPDPALLPDLSEALAFGARAEGLNSYARVRILPVLERAVRASWPYDAAAFLATDGGYSAIYTLLHALVPPGAPVAVEDPTGLRILDILEDMNVPIVPVACDRLGPRPDALAEALERRPAMFIFQPRVHAVTGNLLSARRLDELGRLLQRSDTLVVENDGIGDVADAPRMSLGGRMPDRVIHVLSYSKALGPDLRLAVMSSSAVVAEQIQTFRGFSAGWTSRILQAATAWLLDDPATAVRVAHARSAYQARREKLAAEFRSLGVVVEPGHGLSFLVPVAPGHDAASLLLGQGIAVAPGRNFSLAPLDFIRVAASCVPESQAAETARIIARALTPGALVPSPVVTPPRLDLPE
ncbi:aminotransferase-like domain-containing protein [Alsobacter sp. SYSU BS001988]